MIDSASFEHDPRSPQQARRFVIDRLQGHDSTVIDDVVLMASELVTNSIQHATGIVKLTLEITARTIRVTVTDAGPGRPNVQNPKPEEPNGRGLRLIAKLADEWGAGSDHDGLNTVWFSLHLDPLSRRQHANVEADVEADTGRRPTPQNSSSEARPQSAPRRSDGHQPPPSMALTRPSVIAHRSGRAGLGGEHRSVSYRAGVGQRHPRDTRRTCGAPSAAPSALSRNR